MVFFRKWKRGRGAEAVVAFSVGWVEGESAFADRAKVSNADEDELLVVQKVVDEFFGSLETCGNLKGDLDVSNIPLLSEPTAYPLLVKRTSRPNHRFPSIPTTSKVEREIQLLQRA